MRVFVVVTVFVALVSSNTNLLVEAQSSSNLVTALRQCPNLWQTGELTCYRFFQDVKRTWQQSKDYCESIGAKLLSINSEKKHREVSQWLAANDAQNLAWYTSGKQDETETNPKVYYWETLQPREAVKTFFFWNNAAEAEKKVPPETVVTYVKSGNNYGWDLTNPTEEKAFICESPRSDVERLSADSRDFTYGQADISNIRKGPSFILQPPRSVIYAVSKKNKGISFECVADGNPQPSYRWMKEKAQVGQTSELAASLRYTLSNGKLTIHNPSRSRLIDPTDEKSGTDTDVGIYQCAATNKYGTILSNKVHFDFGYINDFSKTKRDAIRAKLNFDITIPCKPPPHFPSVRYKWHFLKEITDKDDKKKKSEMEWILPSSKPYIFISQNGKLYFSHVKKQDAGKYFCIVNVPLPGFPDGKTSMPIQMTVGTGGDDVPPQMHSDFPAAYPPSPEKGQDVSLECFARGTGTLEYSWSRADGRAMSSRVTGTKRTNENRVLNIRNIQMEDAGVYVCTVRATGGLGGTGTDSKPIEITVKSLPFFTKPLRNHHVDVGGSFNLHCEADGKPEVSYSWYKNGQPFNAGTLENEDVGRITFNKTRVFFKSASAERDNAMYQCAVNNIIGTSYSAAEVRVLSFAPSFSKRPMDPVTFAAVDGKATLVCSPEAAPEPVKVWFKDGQRMTVSMEPAARIHMLKNGNLELTKITKDDEASYSCMAENSLGKATTNGSLIVLSKSQIVVPPQSQIVRENENVHLTCEAEVNPSLDYTYIWELNQYPIDLDFNEDWRLKQYRHLKKYKRGTGAAWGDLFITNITYAEAGIYTCIARTPQDQASAWANVTVIGKPGAPAGVKGDDTSITSSTIKLTWSAGTNHGSLLTSYTAEAISVLNPKWHVVKSGICPWYGDPTSLTNDQCREMTPLEKEQSSPDSLRQKNRLETLVIGLHAFDTYRFRLIAYNSYGAGDPSEPSAQYTTSPAAPVTIPRNVGGGGGKVGTLTITWKPLPVYEHNGKDLQYIITWKRDQTQDKPTTQIVNDPTSSYTVVIGKDLYYIKYLVQVQARNEVGKGPKSKWVEIYSAEGMPTATPMNIEGRSFNSSAIMVLWDPVPDTREVARGKILGYRINYWIAGKETEKDYKRATVLGQTNHGNIIGLNPDTYYEFNVMVFTSAGNGPKSAVIERTTWRKAPQEPPREVWIERLSDKSIAVHWRGIMIDNDEETLQGYIVRYWPAGESMVNAIDHYAGTGVDTVLTNLESSPTRYYLRVLGYSRGGLGKMSSPIVQFQLGPGPYLYVNPKQGSAGNIKPCVLLITTSLVMALLKYFL